jgi:hypothetical protein
MAKTLYVGSILGGFVAVLLLIDAVLSRSSGGSATLALAVVVIPYVMGRAWAGVSEPRARVGDKRA